MTNTQILRRNLPARPVADMQGNPLGHLLAALPVEGDGAQLRLYFTTATPAHALLPAGEGGVIWSRTVSGAPVVVVQCDGSDGGVRLPVQGCEERVLVSPGESALFAGRNVLLGHCNDETPEVIRDWLLWHRSHHGADAALIVDRGQPHETDTLVEAFGALWQQAIADDPELAGMRLMFLGCDIPLGRAGHGPEDHPLYAPDAPGKDRMEAPEADPWRAPLGFALLFDLMRQMFLSRARAVANLELFDLIAEPRDGIGIFDRAQDVPMGVVPLRGERAYPWGLRKDAEPGFGDHICHRFDGQASDNRWCVAPAALPDNTIWMTFRILGAKPGTPPEKFWRFMALRHGDGDKVSRIVPRSSLVESDMLLAIADQFCADPVRIPPGFESHTLPTDHTSLGNRVTIVTTMKNEGPFILEWIAYHRAIGVDDFLIYTNDCTDGTDDFLRLLQRKGYCQWRDNPYRTNGMKPQHAALDAADSEPIVRDGDWAICMDVDEYIAVHTGDGTLRALFDAVPRANLISLTWRLFGNSDIDEYRDGLITQSYTRCAREFCNKPHQAWGFKTLFRNIGLFKKLGVHRPKGLQPNAVDHINWVNGSGKPMPQDQWRNAWRSHSGTYGYDLVSLNHYAVRSAESFLVKRDRGRVNHVDRDQGMAYWFRMNHNVMIDERMHRMLSLLQAEIDRMLSDPDIRAAHEGCVAAHKARIEELKSQPKYEHFHQELLSPRLQKLSRLHGHFGSAVYLAGPEVIPDDIVAHDPEDDFFFTVQHEGETQH